jgi:hypothetical protein
MGRQQWKRRRMADLKQATPKGQYEFSSHHCPLRTIGPRASGAMKDGSGRAAQRTWGCWWLSRCCLLPVGAAAGAVGAELSALGLNQWFLRQVGETLEPGRAPSSLSSATPATPSGQSERCGPRPSGAAHHPRRCGRATPPRRLHRSRSPVGLHTAVPTRWRGVTPLGSRDAVPFRTNQLGSGLDGHRSAGGRLPQRSEGGPARGWHGGGGRIARRLWWNSHPQRPRDDPEPDWWV